MGSLAVALLGMALLAGGPEVPAGQAAPDYCLLMRGAPVSAETEQLKPVRDLVAGGDAAGALAAFRALAAKLEADAERLFFDAEGSDTAPARAFLDEQVNGKGGLLVVRGDRFTLRPDIASYGAFLACRAADSGFGLALLKGGWRDYADVGFQTDAVFLMAALGRWEDADKYLPDGPGGERESLARGVLACHGGTVDAGKAQLSKALETMTDVGARGVARLLLEQCK